MKKYQQKNRTQKHRNFFENLEERLPVSTSILGAVAGSLFLSESRQESQSVSSVVSAETASKIISRVNSAEGILQESSNTFTTGKLKSFVTENLFSTDFLLGEDTVSEDELSTVARSSIANRSANDSVTTAILENDFSSVWSFLSEDDPNELTRQFADDLLLQQTSEANQSTLTSERPLHFSALPPLPIEAVAAPIYAGIATASGGGGISTTSDVPEASQSTASSQTILVGDFSQLSQTSSSSSSSYGDVWFAYAQIEDGAATNYNYTINTTPTVISDTAYVFQENNGIAIVRANIDGGIGWYEGNEWSIEILDPGNYWNITYWSDGVFGVTDSAYDGWWFIWTKPNGLDNNDSSIDRDFTFRFTVANLEPVDLNVHIAWAEVQVQFAGEGDFKTTSSNDTQSEDNTVVVGQKVEAKLDYDPVMTWTSKTWSAPTGGNFVKKYITTNSAGTIVNHTSGDYTADTFEFYYTSKTGTSSTLRKISVNSVFTDPNGHSHGINRDASYYLETPTANSFTSEWGEWSDGGDLIRITTGSSGDVRLSLGGEEYVIDPDWGQTSNSVHGITYQASISTSDYAGGTFAYTQLQNYYYSEVTVNDETNYISSWGHYVIDSSLQRFPQYFEAGIDYDSSIENTWKKGYDSPWEDVGAYDYNRVAVYREDSFKTYLTYKPDGNDSIWITLSVLEWYWEGAMYQSANQWYILPNSTNYGGGTSYTTNVLPTWELNFLTLRLHVNETWDEITGDNE